MFNVGNWIDNGVWSELVTLTRVAAECPAEREGYIPLLIP